ncbi:Uncharacterised protein [Bordetella pertussis]|nr:Uncharacterised protein [Bordetella pertussis]CFP65432.1 Uncharacterised protein [Bordetella pertussis]
MRPPKSPASCLLLCEPPLSCSSRSGLSVGRLDTTLTMPPGEACPYSTEAGPFTTSMRSSA